MMKSRRTFLKKTLPLGLLPLTTVSVFGQNNGQSMNQKLKTERPKVIFFDVNETLLDLEPLKKSIVKILENNNSLGTLWFTTMLQYSLVVTTSNEYFDFGKIGASALVMIAKNNGITLSSEQAMEAVKPILSLPPHPEVKDALVLLKNDNYKLVSFTNSSNYAVGQQLKNAGLEEYFDDKISVEDYGKFKPDRGVYHWAARKMKIENHQCLLVAAHGWDVAGALWAGWEAAFISRPGQQLFPLAPVPQINKQNLSDVAKQLLSL